MKYIITYTFYTIAILNFIFAALLLLFISFMPPAVRYPVARAMCRYILFCLGVRVRVEGEFPDGGPYVVMANHSAFIDPFLVASVIQGSFTGVAALYNYKYPLWAQILRRYKAIPIDRKNRSHALNGIKMAEQIIHNEKYHVAILPEGTRTLTGKMGPLKKGGFHMALNTETRILPIGIEGGFKYKPKKRNYITPGLVTIRIGHPISVDGVDDNLKMSTLMDLTGAQLLKLSGQQKDDNDNQQSV